MSESSSEAPLAESRSGRSKKKFFTVDEARRALPLVSRVVGDIRTAYRKAVELERDYTAALDRGGESEELQRIESDREAIVDRMNTLTEELSDIGCELKDWETGLCDFPALRDDREVCLCWKDGEASIDHWHETYSGFRGRQPLDDRM
jgi:hypothetical protein